MFKFVVASVLVAMVAAQGHYNSDPKTAAILSEQRYQSGNGQFGAAYEQEDGTNFKEETDADGTRHGSYSYIDPSGQKKTVTYTAGKNGFQASGDHLPVAPPAPPQPVPQNNYQPQQQYQAQPYNNNNNNHQQQDSNGFDDGSYDERYNDPSFSQGNQYSAPAPQRPAPAYHAPAPQQQYNQPQQQQYNQPQPQQQYNQQQYNQPQQQYNQPPQYTTPNPHRFQPPGKLSLNRTPDGYSYSFNKV